MTNDPADADLIRAQVEPWLAGRERILWVGRPGRRRFRGELAAEIALGLIMGGVGVAALIVVGWSVFYQSRGAPYAALVVPLFFLGIATVYLRSPWRYRAILGRAMYAVTTDRAFLVNGFGYCGQMNLCPLDEADRCYNRVDVKERVLKRLRRDGSGDIILDGEWQPGRRRRKQWVEIGFFGVDDVDKVDAFLEAIVSSPKKAATDPDLA